MALKHVEISRVTIVIRKSLIEDGNVRPIRRAQRAAAKILGGKAVLVHTEVATDRLSDRLRYDVVRLTWAKE